MTGAAVQVETRPGHLRPQKNKKRWGLASACPTSSSAWERPPNSHSYGEIIYRKTASRSRLRSEPRPVRSGLPPAILIRLDYRHADHRHSSLALASEPRPAEVIGR